MRTELFVTVLPVFALLFATPLPAQEFKFEVASIKESGSSHNGTTVSTSGNGFRAENITLLHLLRIALDAQEYQVSGGPNWTKDARWDVSARSEAADADKALARDPKSSEARSQRMRERVLHMLEERFQLKVRQEQKELPVYSLTIDKAGQKLKVVAEAKGTMSDNRGNGAGSLRGQGITLQRLCTNLGSILERPVIDETGLDGYYDMELKYALDTSAPGKDATSAEDVTGPSIFTAVREQLGLRLTGRKGPVKTWVIEKVERPGEN